MRKTKSRVTLCSGNVSNDHFDHSFVVIKCMLVMCVFGVITKSKSPNAIVVDYVFWEVSCV